MSSCMNVCMLVCMFILGVSLILEDKLGERKEPLQLRMVKLLGPEVIGSLPKFSNCQNSRLFFSDELKDPLSPQRSPRLFSSMPDICFFGPSLCPSV